MSMKSAAFGLRVHSGWGMLVCISGDPAAPEVVERKRIVIAESTTQGAKQPYHFAETMSLKEAERHLQECAAISERLALQAIREALEAVNARNYRVVGCAMLLASGRELPTLPKILASHALVHTAEENSFARLFAKHVNAAASPSWVFASVNWMTVRARHSGRLRLVSGNTYPISDKLWDHHGRRTRRPAALAGLLVVTRHADKKYRAKLLS